ncbi:MAG TPA: ABC transporter permease [Gemmatimonadaceae bacterium]|nr:ABC transporter permease [Gemmatimonadaceae bacterium]
MWYRRLARRVRALIHRSDVERELAEEFRFHIDQEAAELARLHGLSPDEARRRALVAFGGVEKWRESHHDARGTRWLEESWHDVSFAVRSLRRNRGFASAVVLTLALGIGVNTAMFTLLHGTLLRPLPNRDGERLLYLRQSAPAAKQANVLFSVPEIADYRAGAKTLSAIAEYSSAVPYTLVGSDGQPVRLRVGIVSGNYFDVMGLEPVLGRLTSTRDDGAAAAPVAVLSYDYWMDRFGGDPKVIGRTVRLNDMVVTIVGVVQRAPLYPRPTDIYANTVTSPHHLSATMVTDRSHRMSELFAHLAPNATVEQARAEIARISSNLFHDHPEAYEKAAHYEIGVSQLRQAVNERSARMFWLLMGAAAFVLLIACANVANLTLMRGVGREREMLVRAALGAGTARLRRLLVIENLTLALIGGAIGVLVAFAGLKLLVAFAAQFSPRAYEIRMDAVVLGVGLATSIAAAFGLSFIPRIGGDRALATSLAPVGRRSTLGRGRQRFQRSLVVAQIAVCMVLLTGAGLLVRTLAKLQSVDTGVHAEHVLTIDLPLQGDLLREVMKQPENLAKYERIRDRVAALPGVEMASIGSTAPLRNSMVDFDLKAEGRVLPPNRPTPHAAMKGADTGYFAAAGIPLLAGRGFQSTDRRGSGLVVLLNESFAKQLFGDLNPVGQRIAWTGEVLKFTPFRGDWRTVVGIVGDTRDRGLDNEPTPTVYVPFAQEMILNGALVVRTSADPAELQATILRSIHDVAPRQLIERVRTIDQIRDENVAPRRLNALFITSFGTLAFVIAMVGIAGVLAFSVSSRTAEIGIRMSLGADARRVRSMVLGEGGVLLAFGLTLGFAAALFAARLLRSLLFGVTPHDPVTLGGVALVLAAVGVAACWLPAARAARVDPAVALRAE